MERMFAYGAYKLEKSEILRLPQDLGSPPNWAQRSMR